MDLENQRHDDHEGRMAKSDLLSIAKNAVKMLKMIDENEELMGWVQEKITIAADHMNNVVQYTEYEKAKSEAINRGPRSFEETKLEKVQSQLQEKWSEKYKKSINCNNPKGFSQRAHCAGRKK